MGLYKAVATIEVYLWQDKEPNYIDVNNALKEEIDFNDLNLDDYTTEKVESIDNVSVDWLDAYPHGDNENKTIKELLSSNNK